ncbi:hypothetical protein D3C76_1303700 [compost metagenome]
MGGVDSGGDNCQADDGADGEKASARQRNFGLGNGGIEGIINRNRINADYITQAAGQEHSRQCYNERLNLEIMDDRPHGAAKHGSHQEH